MVTAHFIAEIDPAIVLIITFIIAGCGASSYSTSISPGWHDISVPSGQSFASYVISPDVPGLIVACTSAPVGDDAESPTGPTTIWRTRDGGKNWQRLPSGQSIAGCQIAMVANGNGLFFATGSQNTTSPLIMSQDAGDHWNSLDFTSSPTGSGIADIFALLAGSVYRDGRLYAQELPGSSIIQPFMSVSEDDGLHWAALEETVDPSIIGGYRSLSFAPDYRAPHAWYRLLGKRVENATAQTISQAVLEHSSDDGHTWQVMQRIGPVGSYGAYGSMLTTTATQPRRICASFFAILPYDDTQVNLDHNALHNVPVYAALRTGPPPMPPSIGELAASSDGGATWTSAITTKHQRNDDSDGPFGVVIDPQGNCYLSDNHSVLGTPEQDTATIWRCAPAAAMPLAMAHFGGMVANTLGINPGLGGAQAHLILVAQLDVGRVIYCRGNGPCPANPSPAPRLLWMATS